MPHHHIIVVLKIAAIVGASILADHAIEHTHRLLVKPGTVIVAHPVTIPGKK